jgi:hypothetical protein
MKFYPLTYDEKALIYSATYKRSVLAIYRLFEISNKSLCKGITVMGRETILDRVLNCANLLIKKRLHGIN